MKRKNLSDAFGVESNLSDVESAIKSVAAVEAADAKIVLRDNNDSGNELWTIFLPADDVPALLEFLSQRYSKMLRRLGVDL